MSKGVCYLVGAGPGDPGLITVKGRRCVEEADVIVYDALSSEVLLGWAKKGCELIYAGKRAKDHAIPQEGINDLIVRKTKEGLTVTRLKGGDPLIFGRGGEEAVELAEAGVRFEIVPGISSTVGGVAYAGIPVTHRDYCSQLTIFTGHERPEKGESSLDFEQLAAAPGTKVFVMGVSRMGAICEALQKGGINPETPMALCRWASTPKQETLVGTVGTMGGLVEQHNFKSPAVAVIGEVVREREKINWFEGKPLFGKRVVVTRTQEQAGRLVGMLEAQGAEVLELPTIQILPPEDAKEFARLVQAVHEYAWLIFTSPNGVHHFFKGFFAAYEDARSLGGCRIAAIGPSTAEAIKEYRFAVDLMPEKKFVAEGLLEAFEEVSVENETFLWVKAAETREVIAETLTKRGAILDRCVSYRTVPVQNDETGKKARFQEDGADFVIFTSASTVKNFFALDLSWPEGCKALSIGPITTAAIRAERPEVEIVEAEEATLEALVEAAAKYGV